MLRATDKSGQLRRLSFISQSQRFFNPLNLPATTTEIKDATELFTHIQEAHHATIFELIDKNPALMFITLTDLNGDKISPLQHAIYLLDAHTVKYCFDKIKHNTSLLRKFYQQSESSQTIHFNFKDLFEAYDHFIQQFFSLWSEGRNYYRNYAAKGYLVDDQNLRHLETGDRSLETLDRTWLKLGTEQLLMPVHMLKEFAQTSWAYAKFDISKNTPPYRDTIVGGNKFEDMSIYSGEFRSQLGKSFALSSISSGAIANISLRWQLVKGEEYLNALKNDKRQFRVLRDARIKEIEAIKAEAKQLMQPILLLDKQLIQLAGDAKNIDSINDILNRGANPNYKNEKDLHALYYASEKGNIEIMQALLNAGADVNLKYKSSDALHTAAHHGKYHAVQLLLQHGANADSVRTDVNATPLFFAAENGHTEVVKLLLSYGANESIVLKLSAADLIKWAEDFALDVQARMQEHINKFANKDKVTITPLEIARITGKQAVVDILSAPEQYRHQPVANAYEVPPAPSAPPLQDEDKVDLYPRI